MPTLTGECFVAHFPVVFLKVCTVLKLKSYQKNVMDFTRVFIIYMILIFSIFAQMIV